MPFSSLPNWPDRLGYGHLYPQNEEELLRYVLQGSPFTLEEVRAAGGQVQVETAIMQYKKWEKGLLRPDGRPGFDTPTGKFEIASTILEEHGYDPLPVYTEPLESPLSQPELAQEVSPGLQLRGPGHHRLPFPVSRHSGAGQRTARTHGHDQH